MGYNNPQVKTPTLDRFAARKNISLTRRANTIYLHLKRPVTSDAIVLAPFDICPKLARLLNTGEELAGSTDLFPIHWQKRQRFLWIKGLPRKLLDSGETLVIRLDFDGPTKKQPADVAEFKG